MTTLGYGDMVSASPGAAIVGTLRFNGLLPRAPPEGPDFDDREDHLHVYHAKRDPCYRTPGDCHRAELLHHLRQRPRREGRPGISRGYQSAKRLPPPPGSIGKVNCGRGFYQAAVLRRNGPPTPRSGGRSCRTESPGLCLQATTGPRWTNTRCAGMVFFALGLKNVGRRLGREIMRPECCRRRGPSAWRRRALNFGTRAPAPPSRGQTRRLAHSRPGECLACAPVALLERCHAAACSRVQQVPTRPRPALLYQAVFISSPPQQSPSM